MSVAPSLPPTRSLAFSPVPAHTPRVSDDAEHPSAAADLLTPLKEVFGYGSFRPLQEGIMRASLAGQDVFALLPTGGGKSLCFQLPALARPGLTVEIGRAHV